MRWRGILLIVGHRFLRLQLDHGGGRFEGATREITLDRVAHVSGLGHHNLIPTKRLEVAFDAPLKT